MHSHDSSKSLFKLAAAAFFAASLAPLTSLAADGASKEVWPTQPLRIVVGFPPGTSPDFTARMIAEPLSAALGKPVIVENRPGAAGNIAVDTVARSTDGHTFGVTAHGPLTTSPLLYPSLPYDVQRNLRPLSVAAVSPQLLVIDAKLPITSMREFIDFSKTNERGVDYGSVGVGSGSHLTGELLAHEAGLNMTHIPYSGFPQVTSAILGQQIHAGFMAPSGALEQAKSGAVRVLGVTSSEPSPLAPGVPTIASEAGLPGFNAELWIGAYAPKTMSAEAAQRIATEISAALKTQAVKEKLLGLGWDAVGSTPEEMNVRIVADSERWRTVIEKANVKVE